MLAQRDAWNAVTSVMGSRKISPTALACDKVGPVTDNDAVIEHVSKNYEQQCHCKKQARLPNVYDCVRKLPKTVQACSNAPSVLFAVASPES